MNYIYDTYPKHSAYRNGLLVKEHKSRGGTYIEKNNNMGLNQWFQEDWNK